MKTKKRKNCIICNREIPENYRGLVTCSRQCARSYVRIHNYIEGVIRRKLKDGKTN